MKIDFSAIEEKVLPAFKGGEGAMRARMYTDENNRILRGVLGQKDTIGYHTHDTSSEIIYILQGTARYTMDGEEEVVTAGSVHYCPKGHAHGMANGGEGELVFVAVVPQQ